MNNKKVNLYKGDCLEVMKTIEDNSIDAIITDPPYGTTSCSWDIIIPFDIMWGEIKRITKPNFALIGRITFTNVLMAQKRSFLGCELCSTLAPKQNVASA